MDKQKKVKKNDGVKRENYTTNISSELLHRFRIYCVTNNLYQNDVIENLIKQLLDKVGEGIGDPNN